MIDDDISTYGVQSTLFQCKAPCFNAKHPISMQSTLFQCKASCFNAKHHVSMQSTLFQCKAPCFNAKHPGLVPFKVNLKISEPTKYSLRVELNVIILISVIDYIVSAIVYKYYPTSQMTEKYLKFNPSRCPMIIY